MRDGLTATMASLWGRLVALNRRPKMRRGVQYPSAMMRYARPFAPGLRAALTPALLLALVMPLVMVAAGYKLGGLLWAAGFGLLSAFQIRVMVFALPPVPTWRARLEVRQNDLCMELALLLATIDDPRVGWEEPLRVLERRRADLAGELDQVEAALSERYADWRAFLAADHEGSEGEHRVR